MKFKFSKKVRADTDAYYMSCPEVIGRHIASQLSRFDSCVELCSAAGLLTVQLARIMKKVYAVEIDAQRVKDAIYNAKLYGVDDKIDFIKGDVLDANLLKSISADVAIIDPDWSKDAIKSNHVLTINETQPNMKKIYELSRKYITKNCVSRIPKTWTFKTLKDFGHCKIENIIWNGAVKFKVVYFLDDIKNNKELDISFD